MLARAVSSFLLISVLAASMASAQCTPGVPDPNWSTAVWLPPPTGSCVGPVFCPSGDVTAVVDVFVRDCTGAPIAGISACSVVLQSGTCRLWTGSPCRIATSVCASAPTTPGGHTQIVVNKAAGCCQGLRVAVQGVLLNTTLPYRSYDLDADGRVGQPDLNALGAGLGFCFPNPRYKKCFDFSCGPGLGCVDATDVSLFVSHMGHFCQ